MLCSLLCSAALGGVYYPDGDGDGAGDASRPVVADAAPAGHVADGSDCDDGDPAVNPDADEACNGVDDDCDARVDESACPCDATSRGASTYLLCETERSWSEARITCETASYHLATITGQQENDFLRDQIGGWREFWWIGLHDVGGGYWEWEDGAAVTFTSWAWDQPNGDSGDLCAYLSGDDGDWYDWTCGTPSPYLCEVECDTTWFQDSDGDGFGAPGSAVVACGAPDGWVLNDADCDDGDPDVSPLSTGDDCGSEPTDPTDPTGPTDPGDVDAPWLDAELVGSRGTGCACDTRSTPGGWWLALALAAYTRRCLRARR